MDYKSFKEETLNELTRDLESRRVPPGEDEWMVLARRRHPELEGTEGWAGPPNEREHEMLPNELIWSYWLEEGGLVQTMHAISLRFQNKARGAYKALARFDASPLRPLSELLWGYIQDEVFRLSLMRRAHEYAHQYGIRLIGRAVGRVEPADDRARFLPAFHEMLNSCVAFYKQFDNKMIDADAHPLLAKLKDLHLVLAEGAHNQYGDLPFQARHELLLIQKILEQDELSEFLGGRRMLPYPEPWMDRVDSVRRIMRWGDASVVQFANLAKYGENILLAVRRGPFHPGQAEAGWALAFAEGFRDAISQYISSYQAVTGVDLGGETHGRPVDSTQPSVYLNAREARFRRAG
jgi:hypothetical protein